jgi:hypothetical protein
MGNCLRVCAVRMDCHLWVSMFDTPDLTPLCVGIFVALLVGIIVVGFGPNLEERLAK